MSRRPLAPYLVTVALCAVCLIHTSSVNAGTRCTTKGCTRTLRRRRVLGCRYCRAPWFDCEVFPAHAFPPGWLAEARRARP